MKAHVALPLALLLCVGPVAGAKAEEPKFSDVRLGTVEDPGQSQTDFPADTQAVVLSATIEAQPGLAVSGNAVFEFDPATPGDDVTVPLGRFTVAQPGENVVHFNIGGMPGGFPSRANRFELFVNDGPAETLPFTVDIAATSAEELGFGLLLLGTAPDPDASQTVFSPDTPQIVLTAVRFMPLGTRVSGTLVFEGGPDEAGGATLAGGDIVYDKPMNVVHFTYSKPDAGWPRGTNRIDVLVNGTVVSSVPFTVE